MRTLNRLLELKASGQFHNATARQQGQYTFIHIYSTAPDSFRGFQLACSTSNWPHSIDEYKRVLSNISGLHFGSYGNG